ncbi:hypothetical protein [Ruegeria sp. Ofav3-42]|uniref:hypothetical protein n=1 Tax=Ruegeria sp. Ofav3-42 TaxID=2917759 RepID=UPI001EF61DEF|nr:hypothetical protein [Ruegeria sp. Ofav3-42]MCG7519831.1 hypothetical protein [Ruegeria sp. Ofav3-42]
MYLIIYAGNLYLVVPARQKVEAAANSLTGAVALLPGGNYIAKLPIVLSAEQGINVLRHYICLCNGQVYDCRNQSNQQANEAKIARVLERATDLHAKHLETGEDHWLALAQLASQRRLAAERVNTHPTSGRCNQGGLD